jgi:hypothetical protein
MAYTSGSTILAADYNGFASTTVGANVNATWNTAYGQPAIATVAATNTVTATQWASLVNTIASMAAHQPTTITARSAPTAGTTISILSAVNTDITNCFTNRYNAVSNGTQFTGWTGTNSKLTQTGTSGGAAWTITFTNTVTWASAAAAGYFFDAGGRVQIQVFKNATGLTGDPAWNDLAQTLCGTINITKGGVTQTIGGVAYTGTTKTGGTGTPTTLATTTGWDSLTTGGAATIVYKQFSATAPYTTDFIQHSIAKATSSTQLVITTLWSANDTNTPPVGGTDPISGGTATVAATFGTAPATLVTYFPPESTNLTTIAWGTPTVAATTV